MRTRGRFLRRGAWALGALLLANVLSRADLISAVRALAGAPWLWLLPVPWLMGMAFDTLGWRRLLARGGAPSRFLPLLAARAAADAVGHSLPSGPIGAEAVATMCMASHGVDRPTALATLAARRAHLVFAHALLLAVGTLFAWPVLAPAFAHGGLPWLPWLALGCASSLLGAAAWASLRGADLGVAERVRRGLRRSAPPGARRWLYARRPACRAFDRALAFALDPRRPGLPGTVALFVAAGLADVFEALLILFALGVRLPPIVVLGTDSLLSMVRAAAFAIPAGLGIQDAGYAWALAALGVPAATTTAAAFVIAKRAREALFIGAGYWLLGRAAAAPPSLGEPEPCTT